MKRYKKYIDNNKMYITEYSSLSEFINDINSLPTNKYYADRELSSHREEAENGYWYKTTSYNQATILMKEGWDSEAKKMAAKVKMTNTLSTVSRSSKPAYGVVGSQASVPRYLQGIPTNMVSRQTTYSKQRVVTITKGISYRGSFTAEQILEECIKALQIIQSMENGGQRVRLNVMVATQQNRSHSICKVCIKQPDERLNLSKMAFSLAHPSMLRRFFFRWIEVDPFIEFDLGRSYGFPSSLIKEAMEENEYYIPEKIADINELMAQFSKGVKKPVTAID